MEHAPQQSLSNGKCNTRITTHGEKRHVGSVKHDQNGGKICGSEDIKVLEHNQITTEVVVIKVAVSSLIQMLRHIVCSCDSVGD